MTIIQKHAAALELLKNGYGWEDIRLKLSIPENTIRAWIAAWRADGTLARLWP